MTADPRTIAYYDAVAHDYADRFCRSEPDADLAAFMRSLPPLDAPVLDWGCGPANSAAIMSAHDIQVMAVDASRAMAEVARDIGIIVRVEPLDALTPVPTYRGIWANFSLIHYPHEDVPGLIALAASALVSGGILHLGMEEGSGEERDDEDCLTSFFTLDEIGDFVARAGLVPERDRRGSAVKANGEVLTYIIHQSRKPAG